jgi:putative oxidoreductase
MIELATARYAALILRTCLGIMFIAHAMLKWRVFTIPGTIAFFQTLGVPGGSHT